MDVIRALPTLDVGMREVLLPYSYLLSLQCHGKVFEELDRFTSRSISFRLM